MTSRLSAALVAVAVIGCAAAATDRYARKGPAAGWTPRKIAVLFPSVEAGAARPGAPPGGRPRSASEVAAGVHRAVREALARRGPGTWTDPAESAELRARAAQLGEAIHRDWWATGQVRPRVAGELARRAGADAVLIVEVFRFGPSPAKLELKGAGSATRPAAGPERRRGAVPGAPGDWTNCGVRAALVRASDGQVAWEAGALDSRPDAGPAAQEASVDAAVATVMRSLP